MKRLIFFSLIVISSCTSLQTLTSVPQSAETKNDYRFYDAESKIRYQITNDDKNLYIKLNTIDRTSILKMFRTGFSFNFDVNGKKQTKVYFQYPLTHNGKLNISSPYKPELKSQHSEPDLKSMIVQLSKIGIFVNADKSEQIDVLSADSDIKVAIETLNNEEITYELSIPFNRISPNGLASLSGLSIGIVSGKLEMHANDEGRSAEMQDGESSEGMQGGGVPGSMERGGRAGGSMQGGGRSGGGMHPGGMRAGGTDWSAMANPIEFWFKVDFTK